MKASIWEEGFRPPLWDRPFVRRRSLSHRPEVIDAVITAFQHDPQTGERLSGLHFDSTLEFPGRLFLSATWVPTGAPVVIKLNADPWELYWMPAIDRHMPGLAPQVFAAGERIGSFAVGWLVLARVPHQLSHDWGDRMYDLLVEAAARFQNAARLVDRRHVGLVSYHVTRESIQRGLREGCPGSLERVLDRLDEDWHWVNKHCGQEVCFGDLAMGNALSNEPAPGGDHILLVDPLPRIAPWAWDAAYCQTLDANSDVRMIHRLAAARRLQGLLVPDQQDLDRLAAVLLAWLAAHRWWSVSFRQEDAAWCAQIERYVEQAASLKGAV